MSVKYLQIYHAIREKILSNEYAINQQLPDEITLTKEFNSSRMTVKKALDLLVSEGLIFRKGEIIKKVKEEDLVEELIKIIETI